MHSMGHRFLTALLLCAISTLFSTMKPATCKAAGDLQVVDLRCEYLVNPIGIDQPKPRLTWRLTSQQRGAYQGAYRILVATSPKKLADGQADLWDSKKVASRETVNIVYEGIPLASQAVCFWKVQIWGQAGGTCKAESEIAQWSMGLLKPTDWKADFISYRDNTPVFKSNETLFLPPAYQYRKDFQATKKPIRRAVIYATALGIYELYVNGQRTSDHWFAPGWTDYHQRAYYRAYDVTELIQSGNNALGAWVADGWYSGYVGFGLLTGIGTERIGRYTYGKTPSIMAQLDIEYEDGSHEIIATDKSWKVTGSGPIREADLLMGEVYDARRELKGWSDPGYDATKWENAVLAKENGRPTATFYEFRNPTEPNGKVEVKGRPIDLGFKRPKLEAFPGVPVRITQQIKPIDVKTIAPGKFLYNLGQNFAGTVRMQIKGPAGTEITLRFGEMCYPDGRLMTENLRKARATDRYILNGDATGETYVPRFTFHGFQYVEVTASPAKAITAAPEITGLVLHSDTPMASQFTCSDAMANQLFKNVVWTQRANFIDLPTDCPQRDERFGWTGDAQVYVGTAAYNADVAAFYTKWLRELMESQRPSGTFPGYAPYPFQHGWDFGTAWADAGVICPWTIWQAYGDTRIIRQCWEPMTRFMQWRKKTSRNNLGVVHGNSWGDWLTQGAATPIDYIDTIYLAISAKKMAQMAEAIDLTKEATDYQELFARIKRAFNAKYVQQDGSLNVDTQTAYALALFADLIPRGKRRATGRKLAEMIQKNGTRMTTGFLGTRPLLPVLSSPSVGQHDLAMFLFQSRAFPSWGYEVDQGATTIWERWDSFTKEDGFGRHNAAMNSFSHYSFGAVCQWMFDTLAGIRSQGTGYQRIIIHPRPAAPGSNAERKVINWVKASYNSVRGPITSNWRVEGDRFDLDVEIPANTVAIVIIPASPKPEITEGGQPLEQAEGIRKVRMHGNVALVSVASGKYHFSSTRAIHKATHAYKTTPPPDTSTNPDGIKLDGATALMTWKFTDDTDLAKWSQRDDVKIECRDKATFLVATGNDPRIATQLADPATGTLVLELKARPAKGTSVEWFWAGPENGYQAKESINRALNAADSVQSYLFRIGNGKPVQQLRLDPMQNKGELQIESITLYQL